jgi:gluconate 2-dehydrogenase gamma chain
MTAGRDGHGLGPELLATLEAVVDRLVPPGEHGPGAAGAHVPRYIASALDGDYRADLTSYREGLAAVDAHAVATFGHVFRTLDPDRQDEVLAALESGAAGTPEGSQAFFELVLRHTREGMFGDPCWGGNADHAGWRLIGYPGPRHEWTAEDQRITGAAGGG